MSDSRGGSVLASTALAVAGGLALLGGAAGDWIVDTGVREVAGVQITEPETTPGIEFAPLAPAMGVASLLAAAGVAATRGRARRAVGVLLALVGAGGVAVTLAGLAAARQLDGQLGSAAGAAVAGGIAVLAAGALAGRGPAAEVRMPARYSIDEQDRDDDGDWRLASGDDHAPP